MEGIEQYVIDYVLKLRKERKLTQGDIATIIGATPAFIGNVENRKNRAKYNLKHINSLADHFGLEIWNFLPKHPLVKKVAGEL